MHSPVTTCHPDPAAALFARTRFGRADLALFARAVSQPRLHRDYDAVLDAACSAWRQLTTERPMTLQLPVAHTDHFVGSAVNRQGGYTGRGVSRPHRTAARSYLPVAITVFSDDVYRAPEACAGAPIAT